MKNTKNIVLRLLLCTFILAFPTSAFAQISVSASNKKIKQVIQQIEKSSGYNFFYSDDSLDLNKEISIDVKNEPIEAVLNKLFKGTDIIYKIDENKQILLTNLKTTPVNLVKQISGIITDEKGEEIIGASVVEKGKSGNGTSTGLDGKFSFSVSEGAVLQISYLGYETQEITVGKRSHLDISLAEDATNLEEVVVIGYGTIKKADLTGAVTNVGGERLANIQAVSISQALQGAMSGVQVTRSSSMPGGEATIRVRGVTTIGTSDPLIIVDGVPGSLSMNVDDIESISVLKDAASASIYGARAASGVILVTTKRAKEGELSIDYSGTLGVLKATTFPDVVDYKRYMEMINETNWNEGLNAPGQEYFTYSQDYIENYAAAHAQDPVLFPIANWKSYLINNSAPRQKHNLAINYGNQAIKSKASVGYESTDALYNNRSFTSITARINNNVRINKYLSASVDGSFRHTLSKNTQVNPLEAAYKYAPLWSPVYPDGRISGGRDGVNPYARLNYGGFNNSWGNHFTGRIALDLTPVKGLTITGVFAPTISDSKGKNFVKQIPYYEYEDPTQLHGYITGALNNSLTESRGESNTTTKQLLINYAVTLNKVHELSLLAGYEDYYAFTELLGASSDMMELSNYPYLNRGNLNFMTNTGNAYENAYRSYFGRVNYGFADRYLFQANLRADQSSRFNSKYRTGIFPSVSAGWVISEEPFIKKLDLTPLSFLKFRASWGNLGNERIGNYPYQATMSFINALLMDGTDIVARTTSAQMDYNIENITWERTEVFNVGLDATLLNNRLSLNADYYKKTTHDMLLPLEIPDYMGYNNPEQNAGIMNTKGWDLQVEWKDKIGDFRYSISANLSDYRSVMGNQSGRIVLNARTVIREGSEYNEWYGYLTDGLFLTQEDLDQSPKVSTAVKLGDVKYLDISGPDGEPDGVISPEYDRVLLGGSLPRYIYGGNINAKYKGIDLLLTFQGVGKKNSVIDEDMVHQTSAWYTFPDYIDGKYFSHYNTDEQNAKAKYPRLSTTGGVNYRMSDYWMFDGSYFRLQNVTLGYTLPRNFVNRLQVSNVRLYASVSDLFSINHYPKGWDPETATNAYIAKGFNFGIQVKF